MLGLTGSVGMGKSVTAQLFRDAGAPVYDADAAVHALYAPGGAAVLPVEAAFPGVTVDGGVDRTALGARVMGDDAAMRLLESIVHPLAAETQRRFLEAQHNAGAALVVLDIPLLFETGQDRSVDAVVVATAPEDVQRARVMARPGMTETRFAEILARQTPDAEKRARADFVIDTSSGLEDARAQVHAILDAVREPV